MSTVYVVCRLCLIGIGIGGIKLYKAVDYFIIGSAEEKNEVPTINYRKKWNNFIDFSHRAASTRRVSLI